MPLTILNVDDRETSRYVRTRILSGAGFNVIEADTGEETLALASQERPAVVLLDVHLPDINGVEVCRRLKADPRTREIQVLHLSATATSEALQSMALRSGADGYLIEPVSPELLTATVGALIRQWEIQHELRVALDDLNASKQAVQKYERLLHALMEYIPEGITIADAPDVTVRWVSHYGRELTGRSVEEIEGIPAQVHAQAWGLFESDGVTPADNDRLPLTRAAKYGETVRDEERLLVRPDGTKVWLLCNAGPIKDNEGNVTGGVIAWRDITDRKRTEDQLRRRTKDLARSNEDLQRFAYAVSHDLQEPLRTVASFAALLGRRPVTETDPQVKNDVRFIQDAVARMKRLIDDLLRYSTVTDGGELPFTPMNCQAALDQALSNLRTAIRETGAEVTHDALPHAIGNQSMICQVFQNIIGNAIKYRREDEPPKIHISAEPLGDMCRFSVSDNGLGIDMAQSERIFGVFQRLHGRAEYPGNGIGLAIVRRIVERHGGSVWVESVLRKGSTFYFTLRARPTNAAEATGLA